MSDWRTLSEWATDLDLAPHSLDYLRRHADHCHGGEPILERERAIELLELLQLEREAAQCNDRM
jgi:hypothetical protein